MEEKVKEMLKTCEMLSVAQIEVFIHGLIKLIQAKTLEEMLKKVTQSN